MTRLTILISTFFFLVFGIQIAETKYLNIGKNSQIENSIDLNANQQDQFECEVYHFKNFKEQADSLLVFMQRASISESKTRQKWERKFFCAFPNSFNQMENLFGFEEDTGAAPLYSTKNPTNDYMDKRIFSDVIGYFSELKSIPINQYHEKYININIDGNWQADNISDAFGYHYKLLDDTENACKTLELYSDKEIMSVFRFIFDGPHPNNDFNEKLYHRLKPKIKNQNERLEELLTQSYELLMSEDDGHGH